MELFRHPQGFYYSRPFSDFLHQKQQSEGSAHAGEILALDYLRCREGERAGQAWWQLDWLALHSVPASARCDVGGTEVALSRRTLHGLKDQLLHCEAGRVIVKK